MRAAMVNLLLSCLVVCLVSSASAAELPVYRIGFYLPAIRDANPTDVKLGMGLWAADIGQRYGFDVRVSTYATMQEMRNVANAGMLDSVNTSAIEMARMFTPGTKLRGAMPYTLGVEQGLVLVTAKRAGIKKFSDLRGKRVVYVGVDDLSAVFLEVQCLRYSHKDCASMLKLVKEKRDLSVIHKVYFGQADAALVSNAVFSVAKEMNPQLGEDLSVLMRFKVKSLNVSMLMPHVDAARQRKLIDASVDCINTPRGKQFMTLLQSDSVVEVDESMLVPFWDLLSEYQDLQHEYQARRE